MEIDGGLIPCHCNPRRAKWVEKQTGLYGELLNWRLEDTADEPFLQKIKMLAEKFAKSPQGWLAFWGPYGGGKSWFLVGIVHRCLERGIKARYIEAESLLQEWRDTFREDDVSFSWLFQKMAEVPVLAIDELDKIHGTDWAIRQLTRILHQRYTIRNGTIFGLNKHPSTFMKNNGLGSVLSRLEDDRNFGIIKIDGPSRRKRKR